MQATGSTPVTQAYTNQLGTLSYSFYNQLGQLVASITPEGVEKLLGTGLDSYASRYDIPFATLYGYDRQGRLVRVRDHESQTSDYVYDELGKVAKTIYQKNVAAIFVLIRIGIDIATGCPAIQSNTRYMNVKRIFGTILTVLGIGGLIYTGVGVVQHSEQVRELIVVGIIGLIFFVSGISLIRNTRDTE